MKEETPMYQLVKQIESGEPVSADLEYFKDMLCKGAMEILVCMTLAEVVEKHRN